MPAAPAPSLAPPLPRPLSVIQVLVFHFAPGLIVTLAFVLIAWSTAPFGWPPSLALLLAWIVAGLPALVGLLYFNARRVDGAPALAGALPYRQPVPMRQSVGLVLVLLVWAALASTLLFPFAEALRLSLGAAWPEWLNLSTLAQDPAQYSRPILWTLVALSAVLNVVIPITEELYFRGFLLPRLPGSPRWTPLVSTVLFSLYHLWWPWDILGRVVALLPIVYVVQWKRNVYLSIWVHCLLNLTGTLGLAAVVLNAPL